MNVSRASICVSRAALTILTIKTQYRRRLRVLFMYWGERFTCFVGTKLATIILLSFIVGKDKVKHNPV